MWHVFVEETGDGGEVGVAGVGAIEGDGELGIGGDAEEGLVGCDAWGVDA